MGVLLAMEIGASWPVHAPLFLHVGLGQGGVMQAFGAMQFAGFVVIEGGALNAIGAQGTQLFVQGGTLAMRREIGRASCRERV